MNDETNETLIIVPISLQNDTFQEIFIETPDLENKTLFTNVIAMGNIYEDIEEILFYNEKTYIYEKPSEDNNYNDINKKKNKTLIITVIVISIIIFIIIIIGIMCCIYKSLQAQKLKTESKDDKRYSINDIYHYEEDFQDKYDKYETPKEKKELEDFKTPK